MSHPVCMSCRGTANWWCLYLIVLTIILTSAGRQFLCREVTSLQEAMCRGAAFIGIVINICWVIYTITGRFAENVMMFADRAILGEDVINAPVNAPSEYYQTHCVHCGRELEEANRLDHPEDEGDDDFFGFPDSDNDSGISTDHEDEAVDG